MAGERPHFRILDMRDQLAGLGIHLFDFDFRDCARGVQLVCSALQDVDDVLQNLQPEQLQLRISEEQTIKGHWDSFLHDVQNDVYLTGDIRDIHNDDGLPGPSTTEIKREHAWLKAQSIGLKLRNYAGTVRAVIGMVSRRDSCEQLGEDLNTPSSCADDGASLPNPHVVGMYPEDCVPPLADLLPVLNQSSRYRVSEPLSSRKPEGSEKDIKNHSYHKAFGVASGTQTEPTTIFCQHCDALVQELEICRQALQRSGAENERLRIELFHSLKEAKQFPAAEMVYSETIKRDPNRGYIGIDSEIILDLKFEYVEMQIQQQKAEESERIAREVWEQRKRYYGPLAEVTKQSHRQVCRALCAGSQFEEAEIMHRQEFHKETIKDSWALENGDQLCRVLEERQELRKADIIQDDVWKRRQSHDGPRHESTLQSGLRRVSILEKIIMTLDKDRKGPDERDRRRKKVLEEDIHDILQEIWAAHVVPETEVGILIAGHKLGLLLYSQGDHPKADPIFTDVFEWRKSRLGEHHLDTSSSGYYLGLSKYRQKTPEKYARAVGVLSEVWAIRKQMLGEDHADTLSCAYYLGWAHIRLEDYAEAEPICEWVWEKKKSKFGATAIETIDAHYDLGLTLFKQGATKYRGAEIIFESVFEARCRIDPRDKGSLKSGHMLADSIAKQGGKAADAIDIVRDVYAIRLEENDTALMDSGHLYAALLVELERYPEAEEILEGLWVMGTDNAPKEKLQLQCGHLYGQCLLRAGRYQEAVRVLEDALQGKEVRYRRGGPEIQETSQLLEEAQNRLEEVERRQRLEDEEARRRLQREEAELAARVERDKRRDTNQRRRHGGNLLGWRK